MAISCDKNDLATAARCYMPLSWRMRQAIRIYLLCATINKVIVDCTANALSTAAACFTASFSAAQMDAIETYLLCQLNTNITGGVGFIQVFSGNYGGAAPGTTPTTSAAIAYDLDSPYNQWRWSGSAWGP